MIVMYVMRDNRGCTNLKGHPSSILLGSKSIARCQKKKTPCLRTSLIIQAAGYASERKLVRFLNAVDQEKLQKENGV